MQPAPSPSAGRGDVVLQPAFFTSVLYVRPLRRDTSILTDQFREQYSTRDSTISPFSVFKQLWRSEGWKWLHFRVFDDRARETFLLVTIRIFLEQLMEEDPIARVVGLFGAYTFYYSQPENTAPKLYRVNHIPIPLDHFKCIVGLSETLFSPELSPLREPVMYIASTMIRDQVFYVLPSSNLGPENPRYLPREVLIGGSTPEPDFEAPKKKGRPSWRDKAKKAQLALEELDIWLDTHDGPAGVPSRAPVPYADLARYRETKAELTATLENETITQANIEILNRLREAQASQREDPEVGYTGVERVEKAVTQYENGERGGVLGLLEGAGNDND